MTSTPPPRAAPRTRPPDAPSAPRDSAEQPPQQSGHAAPADYTDFGETDGDQFSPVQAFLADLGLDRYAEAFRRNDVDQATLLSLTEAELESLGVDSLGARKRIVRALDTYRKLLGQASGSSAPDAAALAAADGLLTNGGSLAIDGLVTMSTERRECFVRENEFVLQSVLGQGNFGVVFKARFQNQIIAVKKLSRALDASELRMFVREVVLLRELRNPGIVQFISASFAPPNYYLAMEFMHRGSLFDVLRHHPELSAMRRVEMLLDIACGMDYLHQQQPPIVHRDLTPFNILVNRDWRCKISDFGVSRTLAERKNLTLMPGHLRWSAPEITLGNDYDLSSDVFSFALVAWQMFSGVAPFDELEPMAAAVRMGVMGVRPDRPADCPDEIFRLMCCCWAAEPAARPPFSAIVQVLAAEARVLGSDVPEYPTLVGTTDSPSGSEALSGYNGFAASSAAVLQQQLARMEDAAALSGSSSAPATAEQLADRLLARATGRAPGSDYSCVAPSATALDESLSSLSSEPSLVRQSSATTISSGLVSDPSPGSPRPRLGVVVGDVEMHSSASLSSAELPPPPTPAAVVVPLGMAHAGLPPPPSIIAPPSVSTPSPDRGVRVGPAAAAAAAASPDRRARRALDVQAPAADSMPPLPPPSKRPGAKRPAALRRHSHLTAPSGTRVMQRFTISHTHTVSGKRPRTQFFVSCPDGKEAVFLKEVVVSARDDQRIAGKEPFTVNLPRLNADDDVVITLVFADVFKRKPKRVEYDEDLASGDGETTIAVSFDMQHTV